MIINEIVITTINNVEYINIDIADVDRRKKEYKEIKVLSTIIYKDIHKTALNKVDCMYIPTGDLIQYITDMITTDAADDVNIFDYIPGFLMGADDSIINMIYNAVAVQCGFMDADAATTTPAAQDVDAVNNDYYINDSIEILNNISVNDYTMEDGGPGHMYILNDTLKVILITEDGGAALDVYNNNSIIEHIDGAEEIHAHITADIIPVLHEQQQDADAIKWEYENTIEQLIQSVTNRVKLGTADKHIWFRLNKPGAVLHVYIGKYSHEIIEGKKEILLYINKFKNRYFTMCGDCCGTGEHWDGATCKTCGGTALKSIDYLLLKKL